jgi:4-amino-4-deoxy-L-arabinose transferase-like glycosyltransferase
LAEDVAAGRPAERIAPRQARLAHALLLVLLLGFGALATLYNATIPLGEGPDEPGHLAYVVFLSRTGQLPIQRAAPAASDVPGEGHQPPLAYALMTPAVAWLPPAEQQVVLTSNPVFRWNGGAESAAYLRGSQEYWPWQGMTLAWHLARGVSTLCALATLLCIWGAARSWFAAQPGWQMGQASMAALLAAGLVACNPQFLFSAALVTNDTLLAALSAALCWLCLLPATSARLTRHALLLGLLFGLALLTKQSALLLGPLLLWASWQAGAGNLRRTLRHLLTWGGAALACTGWWFLRNWQLYGDPLGLSAFRATYATQPFRWQEPAAWGAALVQLHDSFWARFGWLTLRPPDWLLWLYGGLALLALAGLLRGYALRRYRASTAVPLLLLLGLALLWTVSFALLAGLVAWQGRMLFPALAALAILLAAGLWALAQRAALLVLLPLAALALWLPFGVIAPAYEWRTLPHTVVHAELPASTLLTYARYAREWEQGAVLRRWQVQHAGVPLEPQADGTLPVQAGTTIDLVLTWHALGRVEQNWTVFVHLVDSEGQIVAEHNSIPQGGALPMPLWTPGDWLHDTHPLHLPATLPPGDYTLRVGLYLPWQRDPQQGHRAQVWNAAGEHVGDFATLGQLRVAAPASVPAHD